MAKKIVHILLTRPNPQGSGGDLRNHAVHQALVALGDTVLLAVDDFLTEPGTYPPRKLSTIELDLPVSTITAIVEKVQASAPDLIVLEGVLLSDIAHALTAAGYGYVLDMHNVESDLRMEIDRKKRGFLAPLRYRRRWQAAAKAEAAVITAAKAVMVCSEQDGHRAMARAGRAITWHIVPNPIPSWACDRALPDTGGAGALRLLFVGHLGYAPNIVAAERLLSRILPAVLRDRPDAILDICGRAPHPRLRALVDATPQARLHPDPTDLFPFYAAATMAVIPLTEGGGTRLKVLEALAVRLPVIASAKAVEGIGLVPGQHYLAAETDSAFVQACLRLAANARLAARLTHNGQTFVQDRFSPAAITRAVAAVADLADPSNGTAAALDGAGAG
jgi:glycosyltransferase involved in cell wall biosynthesis